MFTHYPLSYWLAQPDFCCVLASTAHVHGAIMTADLKAIVHRACLDTAFSPHWLADLSILSPFERLREPQLPVAGWVFDFLHRPLSCRMSLTSCLLPIVCSYVILEGKELLRKLRFSLCYKLSLCLLDSGFLETRNLILSHQSLVLANKSFVLKIVIHFRIPFCTSVNTAFLDYM